MAKSETGSVRDAKSPGGIGAGPAGITFDATHLWVANHDEGTIAKVDPVSGEVVMTVVVGAGPTELVVVDGSVWVTLREEGSVVQVDANSGTVTLVASSG